MTEPSFSLRQNAEHFVTRDAGRRLREELLKFDASSPPNAVLTIDASEVALMTPSFVDEFFGRTVAAMGLERFRARFRIVGIEAGTRILVNKVVRNRMILDARPRVTDAPST